MFSVFTFVGLRALVINNWYYLYNLLHQYFRYQLLNNTVNSRPFHTNTGSDWINSIIIWVTATFAFSPGILTAFFIVIRPSKTSGISCSNNFSKNKGDVLESIILGLFLDYTFSITPLTLSPFLKKSFGIFYLRHY